MPTITGINYIGLSVRDARRSAAWYLRLLNFRKDHEHVHPDGHVGQVMLRDPTSGAVIDLLAHRTNPSEPFQEHRTGLDHFELSVASYQELQAWATKLDSLHIPHSGIKQPHWSSNAIITVRDPDSIQFEFISPNQQNSQQDA